MSYITGSVTDANPGPALHALMAPALTEAGFTLVDTVVISTRTHKVWKSAAANNTQGLDWYLDVAYTTAGAGTITLQPFEMFDPATDLGYRGGYTASSTTIDATTSSRYGATGSALETNWIGGTGFTSYASSITTTAFGYWLSATPDRAILMMSTEPTRVAYTGLYQPDAVYASCAGGALYPLVAAKLTAATTATSHATATAATAALTRIPPSTSISGGSGWAQSVALPVLSNHEINSYPQIPTGSTAAYPLAAFPIEMLVGNGAPLPILTRFGVLRDVAQMPAAGVVRGDTCSISGAQWVLSTTATAQSLLFKAA